MNSKHAKKLRRAVRDKFTRDAAYFNDRINARGFRQRIKTAWAVLRGNLNEQ